MGKEFQELVEVWTHYLKKLSIVYLGDYCNINSLHKEAFLTAAGKKGKNNTQSKQKYKQNNPPCLVNGKKLM